ncbi:MAG: hypothetical protein A2521_01685 [Deltaproteobacteria bacterium RIFOXYD12_FULL_57_12]|nr:MAG: hypothetical protein A2521_01685 [Deltaproteobacteria bacterium RIFOXYD12_FULL_57_12]
MNWKNLFTPVKNLEPDQAREYMQKRPAGTYQLLDVRQPKEYEAAHLPAAIFIPLAELPGRLAELDKEKPVIAYCAIGGRSRAASQLLAAQGFQEVFNLAGGIKAWQGAKAAGPPEEGLQLLDADADFADALTLAFGMEDGLGRFYRSLAETAAAEDCKQLFNQLGEIEETHKTRLLSRHQMQAGHAAPATAPGTATIADLMEGGVATEPFLVSVRDQLTTIAEILDLAMMLETQALDLYGRLARKTTDPEVKTLFLKLAEEEKAHLQRLADELDKTLQPGGKAPA